MLSKLKEFYLDARNNIGLISSFATYLVFEYNGMRNHEVYFNSFVGGEVLWLKSKLKMLSIPEWGSFDNWLTLFKAYTTQRPRQCFIMTEEIMLGLMNNI